MEKAKIVIMATLKILAAQGQIHPALWILSPSFVKQSKIFRC